MKFDERVVRRMPFPVKIPLNGAKCVNLQKKYHSFQRKELQDFTAEFPQRLSLPRALCTAGKTTPEPSKHCAHISPQPAHHQSSGTSPCWLELLKKNPTPADVFSKPGQQGAFLSDFLSFMALSPASQAVCFEARRGRVVLEMLELFLPGFLF